MTSILLTLAVIALVAGPCLFTGSDAVPVERK
jgi:hypothetical protein